MDARRFPTIIFAQIKPRKRRPNFVRLDSSLPRGPFNRESSWEIKGAGDFDGDGKSDILWQGQDGTPAIWLMDGTNVLSVSAAGSFNPGVGLARHRLA
jgi:hypothetical protein